MQNRHVDRARYFEEQTITTKKYVIPYINKLKQIIPNSTILEIGCGEGGNLKPFLDLGSKVTGIDISKGKIENADKFLGDHQFKNNLTLICNDIYNRNDLGVFDIIFLRDVIEHIPNQERFMQFMQNFMGKESMVFFAFPPWQNPFGGHQQMCTNKFLSRLPYFHLLPTFLYKGLLRLFNESQKKIAGLLSIKETGISIERFERILKQNDYGIKEKTSFLINPNYEIKFGLKSRKQIKLISSIPWIRNFFTTAVYYLVTQNNATK
ncbi:MAG: class I SAM-dependent methyltransferase [Bacteroidota bacterium]